MFSISSDGKGLIKGHRKRVQTLLNTKPCRSSIIGVCYGWYYLWQNLDAHISKINKVLVNGLLIDWTEQLSTDGLPRGFMNCNVHIPADSAMYFQGIWLQFKSKYHKLKYHKFKYHKQDIWEVLCHNQNISETIQECSLSWQNTK